MNTITKSKLYEIYRSFESNLDEKIFEFNVNELSLKEREQIRFQLMEKGIKALLYTELNQQLLGVWL